MDDTHDSDNSYQTYLQNMMNMQMEMAKLQMEAQMQFMQSQFMPNQASQSQMPPPIPPQWNPAFCNPWMSSPFMMPPHMMQQHIPQQGAGQPHSELHSTQQANETEPGNDFIMQQAQTMLDDALGEDANTFKEILGTFGMNDKEFWKGAMIGAAAALILGNENVRGKLMGMVSGAGDILKSGGSNIKETATSTASNLKESATAQREIFRDTVAAGKQGYQTSVEKHKEEQVVAETAPCDTVSNEQIVSPLSDDAELPTDQPTDPITIVTK